VVAEGEVSTVEPEDHRDGVVPGDALVSARDDGRGAPTAGDGVVEEQPPLAPHLRDRPDRPRPPRAHARSQSRLLLLLMFGAIPMVVVFVVVLNSLSTGPPAVDARGSGQSLERVTRYCNYTANDEVYEACLTRTDPRVVARQRTNAARYARGELTRCLSDAGPRCTIR
jgi:hypothetical protein